MAASTLAKTMTDEERKKTEAARRIQPVRGVRSSRAKPGDTNYVPKQKVPTSKQASWAKPTRGPATVRAAAAMARQGGTGRSRSTSSNSRSTNAQAGVTNKAEQEETQAQKILRFFGFTHPGKKKK